MAAIVVAVALATKGDGDVSEVQTVGDFVSDEANREVSNPNGATASSVAVRQRPSVGGMDAMGAGTNLPSVTLLAHPAQGLPYAIRVYGLSADGIHVEPAPDATVYAAGGPR